MKGVYILFSLGLASAINIGARHPQEAAESGAAIGGSGNSNNIFDEIINNNIENANRGEDNNRNEGENNKNEGNNDSNRDSNNLDSFIENLKQGGLNLDGLNIGGLNLGSIDLNSQDALAQGIASILAGFCLNNVLGQNNILNLGLNNELELFLELAQLAQLQQLGFLSGTGIRGVFNSGALLGGFNLGVFKREVAEMKKTMKRTKLRRGGSTSRNQCAGLNITSTTTTSAESAAAATSTVVEGSSSVASSVASAAASAAASATATESAAAAEVTASEAVASSTAEASTTTTATNAAPAAPAEPAAPAVPQETSDIVLDNPEG